MTMTRYAVLVGAGNAAPPLLGGPAVDVRRLKTWMMHNNGGAWEEWEIAALVDPTTEQIRAAVNRAGQADYAFVSFSGHGHIEHDSRTGRQVQKIIVGDRQTIDFLALVPKAKRYTLVCDACREVEVTTLATEEVRKALKMAKDRDRYPRDFYRALFDSAVSKTPEGWFTMYGCAPGEYCYDDPLNGGVFTAALIDNAALWCDRSTGTHYLTMPGILTLAQQTVRGTTAGCPRLQNPNGGPMNKALGNAFPFAVSIV